MTPAKLQKAINDLLPRLDADGWRPIEEAPKDGTQILLYRDDGCGSDCVVAHWVDDEEGYNWETLGFNHIHRERYTHFKPLDDSLLKEAAALLRECLPTIKEMEMQKSKEYTPAHGEKHNDL